MPGLGCSVNGLCCINLACRGTWGAETVRLRPCSSALFPTGIILVCVRWYCRCGISYGRPDRNDARTAE
jgi:hypothetical protein